MLRRNAMDYEKILEEAKDREITKEEAYIFSKKPTAPKDSFLYLG